MSNGGPILAADFAANLIFKASEAGSEEYGALMPENFIPKVFNVRPIEQMNSGLYHRETLTIRDDVPPERDPGGDVKTGQIRQERKAMHKRRFAATKYTVPEEHVRYLMGGMGGNAQSMLEAFVRDAGMGWARSRFEAEQKHAAAFFNFGGFLAGHDEFNNSVPGIVDDPGGLLTEDGKPLFALTGNNHVTLGNSSGYFNSVALAFSVANWTTLHNRVGDTNGYSEMGIRVDTVPNLILVPVALDIDVRRVKDADRLAQTANNDANNFRDYVQVVCPYLTDTDAWFLGRKGAGLTWWQGGPPTVRFQEDAGTLSLVLVMQYEFGAQVSPGAWKFWGGSQLSTS